MVLDKTILSDVTQKQKFKYVAFRQKLKENQPTIHNLREHRQQRDAYMHLNSKREKNRSPEQTGSMGVMGECRRRDRSKGGSTEKYIAQ